MPALDERRSRRVAAPRTDAARLTATLDGTTRDRLLRHIGLSEVPAADASGLRAVHRAFVSRVPYEDLAVQLGESEPLEPATLVRRVLDGSRGGYCFEANTVLHTLLATIGFEVERRQGIVGARDAHAHGALTNHMALVAHTSDAGPFIAEAGLGEGPLDPLPLSAGAVIPGVFQYTVEREGDGWWVARHPSESFPGFWFSDAPASLDDFQPHHERLSTSPDSSFVQTLVLQRPFDDHVVTLRGRTLLLDAPGMRERHVVGDAAELAVVLRERFGIDVDVLGAERLVRLWARAGEQHRMHEARE
jgi:N-hydroxyarylamine O-acetyltransferase